MHNNISYAVHDLTRDVFVQASALQVLEAESSYILFAKNKFSIMFNMFVMCFIAVAN
jgi:hypothetical protein